MQIKINQLQQKVNLGITEEERSIFQELIISLKITLSNEFSIDKDDISSAVDYRDIAILLEGLSQNTYQLIETYATEIITNIHRQFEVIDFVQVEIEKTMTASFRFAKSVSVTLDSDDLKKTNSLKDHWFLPYIKKTSNT